MARKRIETEMTNEERLVSVSESYIANKEKADKFGKLAKSDNEEIKSLMTEMDVTSCDTESGTVKMSTEVRESFREEDLIAFLKEHDLAKGIVKRKEYVDFDALESAIYHEKISNALVKKMDNCKDKQTILKLRISKKKGA